MSGEPRDGDRSAWSAAGGNPTAEPVTPGHYSVQSPGAARRRHPLVNYAWHAVISFISVLVLLVTGVYWNIVSAAGDGLAAGNVNAGLGDTNGLVTVAPTAQASAPNGTTVNAAENFLLVGSDTRAGANNIDGSGADLQGIANTDSVMLLHVSANREHIYAVSLPRDMWMPNVACEAYNQSTNSYGGTSAGAGYSKLHVNSFYGVGGPKCLVDAVENLTQLNITRYIQIDFSGFASMVDALGGVTVNACGPIVDATLSTILANGGSQLISGDQALSLARARKVAGDPASDLSRIHRQQLILSAILREVKSAGTLLDPTKLSGFVKAFTENTTTSGVDFQSLMDLAVSMGNLDPARVSFYTIPTVPDTGDSTGRGSMFVDQTNAAPLLNALRNDQAYPSTDTTATTESTAPTTGGQVTTLTVAPQAVDLQIVNASGTSGVATKAQTALSALGFPKAALKSDSATQADITVQYSTGNEATALTVASAVTGAKLEATDGLGSLISLRLGSSYSGKLTAVAAGDPIPSALLAAVPAGSAGNVITPSSTSSTSSSSAATGTTPLTAVVASDTSCL